MDIVFSKNPIRAQNFSPEEAMRNIQASMAMGLTRFGFKLPKEQKKYIIIGGGPTAKPLLPVIDQRKDAIKVLAGSSHRLVNADPETGERLLQNGADICVMNQPGADYASHIGDNSDQVAEYWLASWCDPAVFEAIIDQSKIKLIHGYHEQVLIEDSEEESVIGIGTSAPAMAVAAIILSVEAPAGIEFELPGVDGGSFEELDFNDYVYNMDDIKNSDRRREEFKAHVLIEIDGRQMKVPVEFWEQANEMRRLIKAAPDCTFTFYPGSLNHMLFNQGLEARVIYDPRVTVGQNSGPPVEPI